MLPSTNGLTNITQKNVCFYRGTIDLRFSDRLCVLSRIKEWMEMHKKDDIHVQTESITSFYYDKHNLINLIEGISVFGHYSTELANDNEIYENLYSLFQHLCIKCNQTEVIFILDNEHNKEYKEYKIVPKINIIK